MVLLAKHSESKSDSETDEIFLQPEETSDRMKSMGSDPVSKKKQPKQKSKKQKKEEEEEVEELKKRGELALETQTLLQSLHVASTSHEEELKSAKKQLLDKMKQRRLKQQNSKQRRKQIARNKIPVVRATAHPFKKHILHSLKEKALKQGAEEVAKMFGYANYEEQRKNLSRLEQLKVLQKQKMDQEEKDKIDKTLKTAIDALANQEHDKENKDNNEDDERSDDVELQQEKKLEEEEVTEETKIGEKEEGNVEEKEIDREDGNTADIEIENEGEKLEEATEIEKHTLPTDYSVEESIPIDSNEGHVDRYDKSLHMKKYKRLRKASQQTASRLDKEQDSEDELDILMDSTSVNSNIHANDEAASNRKSQLHSSEVNKDEINEDEINEDSDKHRDRASNFRALLQAEESKSKRKKKTDGNSFLETEADEEEEEDVLNIRGLGDFGFGVPTAGDKKDEDENVAIPKLNEDDLDGIVDDLSDEEKDAEVDLNDLIAKESELKDKEELSTVMRNVREGYGKNKRAFSRTTYGGEVRGRFNIDELVAPDGDKDEAARLGLLESDEEIDDEKKDGDKGKDDNIEEEEEEDEEMKMERLLRERYNRNENENEQIYITSSESENEEEHSENENKSDDSDNEVLEMKQMKSFSERAKINRRLQRVANLQKANNSEHQIVAGTFMEEDEESQEMVKCLQRTNIPISSFAASNDSIVKKRKLPFQSKYSLTKNSTNSFTRIADGLKRSFSVTSTSTTGGKGFVFTSTSVSSIDDGSDSIDLQNFSVDSTTEVKAPPSPALRKSSSWSVAQSKKKANNSKKPKFSKGCENNKHSFLSVLTKYKCENNYSQ